MLNSNRRINKNHLRLIFVWSRWNRRCRICVQYKPHGVRINWILIYGTMSIAYRRAFIYSFVFVFAETIWIFQTGPLRNAWYFCDKYNSHNGCLPSTQLRFIQFLNTSLLQIVCLLILSFISFHYLLFSSVPCKHISPSFFFRRTHTKYAYTPTKTNEMWSEQNVWSIVNPNEMKINVNNCWSSALRTARTFFCWNIGIKTIGCCTLSDGQLCKTNNFNYSSRNSLFVWLVGFIYFFAPP